MWGCLIGNPIVTFVRKEEHTNLLISINKGRPSLALPFSRKNN